MTDVRCEVLTQDIMQKFNGSQGHGRLKLHWNKPQKDFISGDTFLVLDAVENRELESIT